MFLVLVFLAVAGFVQSSDVPDSTRAADPPSPTAIRMTTSGYEILNKISGNDLGTYPDSVLTKVRGKWEQLFTGSKTAALPNATCVLEVTIRQDGSLSKIKTKQSTGSQSLDTITRQAISMAEPFDHFPASLREKKLTLRFYFGYNQPVSDAAPVCSRVPSSVQRKEEPAAPMVEQVVRPSVNYGPDPQYSEQARQLKYQGLVIVGGVVDETGAFTNLCLKQATGNGLDEQAIRTLSTWKFAPATKAGVPVAAYIEIQVTFHLY